MKYLFALSLCFLMLSTHQAQAQQVPPQVVQHIRQLQQNCMSGQWESQACIRALGESNLTLASQYAESLKKSGKAADADDIVQHCAASTASTKKQVPAYAMASAMTECANAMGDTANKTRIKPDLTHYQILIAGALCLSKHPKCPPLERGIANFGAPKTEP